MLSNEEINSILDSHLMQLMEHFDTVQISVTGYEPKGGESFFCSRGLGNWHARYGQAVEWVKRQDEHARQNCRPDNDEA